MGLNDFVAYHGQLLVLRSEIRVIIIDKNGKMEKNVVLAAVAISCLSKIYGGGPDAYAIHIDLSFLPFYIHLMSLLSNPKKIVKS